jgi:hypothetical protein
MVKMIRGVLNIEKFPEVVRRSGLNDAKLERYRIAKRQGDSYAATTLGAGLQ